MKITIQDECMSHVCDYSQRDVREGDEIVHRHPCVDEALDDILELLGCVYGREEVEEAVRRRAGKT